ncbi:MAG TPA: hypothetical protein VI958_06425 [Acidobacteriota bacterium]
MFRITKKFENSATYLYRIEGKVTDDVLNDWQTEMMVLNAADRHVILDFSGVWFISQRAIEILLQHVAQHVFVLNCGMEVRNLFHASGLSTRMLE